MAKKTKEKKPPGKIRKALSWSFKPFVNVFAWINLSELTGRGREITSTIRTLFKPVPKTENPETFEEAKARFNLTDEDIAQKQKDFFRLFIIYALMGVAIIAYGLYIAWFGTISAFLLSMTLGVLALANALRFHFWWYQVQHQKLGCTVQEWLGSGGKAETTPQKDNQEENKP